MQITRYRFDGEDIIDREKLPEHDYGSLAALLWLLKMTGMTDAEIIEVLTYSFKIPRVKAKVILQKCRLIWEATYTPESSADDECEEPSEEEYEGPSMF